MSARCGLARGQASPIRLLWELRVRPRASPKGGLEVRMSVIGLDLGATKLAGALFGPDGTILERAVTLLEGREGDEVGRLIVELMSSLRGVAVARAMEVEAVGVSIPGIVHHEDGT